MSAAPVAQWPWPRVNGDNAGPDGFCGHHLPLTASPNEVVKVFDENQPISYETVWLGLAERLGLPSFGRDAFAPGQDLRRPDDFYLRMVANLANDGKESVPDASDKDLEIFLKGRKHLPKDVFDADRWQAITGPNWKKVVSATNPKGEYDLKNGKTKAMIGKAGARPQAGISGASPILRSTGSSAAALKVSCSAHRWDAHSIGRTQSDQRHFLRSLRRWHRPVLEPRLVPGSPGSHGPPGRPAQWEHTVERLRQLWKVD
jgi:hypothetical protein